MPIDLEVLARQIEPQNTVLVLGAGASVPCGAPTGDQLRDQLGHDFGIPAYEHFSLADLATIIETRRERYQLIRAIRRSIQKLQPTGGMLSLPRFNWSSIFTTNYDDLVEKAYSRAKKPIRVLSSNFDFRSDGISNEQQLFKFHGTIDKDVSDGNNSRIIITSRDYDDVTQYRELLYSRLRDSLFSKSVLIVGQRLNDPDLRLLIDEAQRLKSTSGAPGRILLLIYERSEDLALVFEARGLTVCFGGVDDLFSALIKEAPAEQLVLEVHSDALGTAPLLEPATFNVATEMANQSGQLERMFSGRAASYADIARGWSFGRNISDQLESQLADPEQPPIAVLLGVGGVGKTTAVRMALSRISARDISCWEHKPDFSFEADEWFRINQELARRKSIGVLFIDDAHYFLRELNRLIEMLAASETWALKLVFVSSKPHWNPRLKSSELFKNRKEYELSKLTISEINGLLDLLDSSKEIQSLVEHSFLGFSRPQRLERLRERCDSDMFVCMKNIFGFQGIDTILLEEFASLEEDLQSIYRLVAGMQAIGARVHRELVRRITGLEAANVSRVLADLDGIIEEYTVSVKDGIFGWRVRHPLIASILSKYKYSSQSDLYDLFERVVRTINPAYYFEAQSIDDMCDLETGIVRLVDRNQQNVILRQMISNAPDLRVPRHRLIYNLIELGNFEAAESEIRIFEREIGRDGPVRRYRIRLKLGIAKHSDGIQNEDRAALVSEASAMALKCLEHFPDDKNMYRVYLETSVDWYRYTADSVMFENAMNAAAEAQERLLDPELRAIISRYLRTGQDMGIQVYE